MRLIDADNVNWGRCPVSGYAMKEWLAEQQTIDAVPVVRCKDCKHRGKLYRSHLCDHPKAILSRITDTDFCSYGERKDGEG
jgi:hypothetical protein